MGKMRQIEKNVKKEEKKNNPQTSEIRSLLIIILAVIIIFLIFTAITTLVNPKKHTDATQVIEETVQYDKIIVGEILNRLEDNYYVLVLEKDNAYNELYKTYLDMYISKNKEQKYYTVDLNDAFNQSYLGEKTVVSGKDISKYSFNNSTLIKIKNNKIDKVYALHEDILDGLNKLIK